MILGLGIDIIDNHRIRDTIKKYGNRFKKRCFSMHEIKNCEKNYNVVNSFAKKYAAKEACAKALGTGFSKGIYWSDIEITNNRYGKPMIMLHNKALSRINKISKSKYIIELSLSDEKDYSIANVIIYNNE